MSDLLFRTVVSWGESRLRSILCLLRCALLPSLDPSGRFSHATTPIQRLYLIAKWHSAYMAGAALACVLSLVVGTFALEARNAAVEGEEAAAEIARANLEFRLAVLERELEAARSEDSTARRRYIHLNDERLVSLDELTAALNALKRSSADALRANERLQAAAPCLAAAGRYESERSCGGSGVGITEDQGSETFDIDELKTKFDIDELKANLQLLLVAMTFTLGLGVMVRSTAAVVRVLGEHR